MSLSDLLFALQSYPVNTTVLTRVSRNTVFAQPGSGLEFLSAVDIFSSLLSSTFIQTCYNVYFKKRVQSWVLL